MPWLHEIRQIISRFARDVTWGSWAHHKLQLWANQLWEPDIRWDADVCFKFRGQKPMAVKPTWPLEVWFYVVLLFWVGGLLFQRRSRTESCRHAAAGIPNVSHGNVRNDQTESYGIWRNENSEQSAVPAAVWGIFHNFAFPELPNNKRMECSWERCSAASADPVAACYWHNSYRTWWNHQGANTTVVASRWCRFPMASCNAKNRQLHSPHLVNSLLPQLLQPMPQPDEFGPKVLRSWETILQRLALAHCLGHAHPFWLCHVQTYLLLSWLRWFLDCKEHVQSLKLLAGKGVTAISASNKPFCCIGRFCCRSPGTHCHMCHIKQDGLCESLGSGNGLIMSVYHPPSRNQQESGLLPGCTSWNLRLP